MAENKRKDKPTQLYMTAEEREKLEELARKQTRSMAGVLRNLLNQEYERLQATRQIDSVQQ